MTLEQFYRRCNVYGLDYELVFVEKSPFKNLIWC